MKSFFKRTLAVLLSVMMVFSLMPINTLASENTFVTIVGDSAEDSYTYYIEVNSAPYSGKATSLDGEDYTVTDGEVTIPSEVNVMLSLPVGAEYSIVGTYPETEMVSGVAQCDYEYQMIIRSNKKSITEEQYNEATDNGANETVSAYIDNDNNLVPASNVSQMDVFSALGETRTVEYATDSLVTYPAVFSYSTKLAENTLFTSTRYSYNYTVSLNLDDDTFSQTMSSADSPVRIGAESIDSAKTKCITGLKADSLTVSLSVLSSITSTTGKSASFTEDPTNGVPTADQLSSVVGEEVAPITYQTSVVAYNEVSFETVSYSKIDKGTLLHFEPKEEDLDYYKLSFGIADLNKFEQIDDVQYCVEVDDKKLDDYASGDDDEIYEFINGVATVPSNVRLTIRVLEGSTYSIKVLGYNGEVFPSFPQTKEYTGVMTADTYKRYIGDEFEYITEDEYNAETNDGEITSYDIYLDDKSNIYLSDEVSELDAYVVRKGTNSDLNVFVKNTYYCVLDDVTRIPVDYTLSGETIKNTTTTTINADLSISVQGYAPADVQTNTLLTSNGALGAKAKILLSATNSMPQLTDNVVFNSFASTVDGTVALSQSPISLLPTSISDDVFNFDMTGTDVLVFDSLEPSTIRYVKTNDEVKIVDIFVDPTGHSFTNYVSNNDGYDSTCTKLGKTTSKTAVCDFCDATDTISGESISLKSHTPDVARNKNVIPATCVSNGSYDVVVSCKDCGTVLSSNKVVTDKIAHTVVNDNAVAPTCTNNGLTAGSHCSVCNTVLVAQSIVSATSHSVVEDSAVAPSYARAGLTAGSHCSVCNAVITPQSLVAKLVPPTIKFTKKSGAKASIKLSWKKNSKAKKYEIRYSTKKNMKSAKTVKIAKNSTTSTTIKKLKSKTTYYVQIRTVVVDGKKSYPSAWSKAVKVKTK